ncbi:MAG: hypothetical protein U1B84_13555 [Variovorax sp.]|nr:hypothetical protein [Variovorax sp.]
MTELRVSWEHTFPDDGSKLVIHSNWISNTPATQAYLEALISKVAEMEPAPHCVFEKRKAVPPRSLPPDVGTFTSAEFWQVAKLLHLQATPSLAAARLVLVEGMRPAKAARQLNTSPQALTNALRKIRTERATSSRRGRLPTDPPPSDDAAPAAP